jgi:hypothetical protein
MQSGRRLGLPLAPDLIGPQRTAGGSGRGVSLRGPIIDSAAAASYLHGMIDLHPLRRFRLMAGSLLTRQPPRAEGTTR